MTDADRHDELRDLLALYVLDQLDERERARVERALATDADLRRELGELEHVGARLAEPVERIAAPAAMKHRVMSSVRASAAHKAGGTIEDVADAAESALREEERPRRGRRRRARTSTTRRPWFAAPAFSGALAAACVVLLVLAIDARNDADDATRELNQLQLEARDRANGAPPGFEDARPYTVSTSSQLQDSTGSLIRVSKDKWILMINNVPAPPVGKSWQVWTADSAGLIENVGQWHTGDDHLLVLDDPDIVEVMVSYEDTTRPVPTPSDDVVADVKV